MGGQFLAVAPALEACEAAVTDLGEPERCADAAQRARPVDGDEDHQMMETAFDPLNVPPAGAGQNVASASR